jgi:hypothetical protein
VVSPFPLYSRLDAMNRATHAVRLRALPALLLAALTLAAAAPTPDAARAQPVRSPAADASPADAAVSASERPPGTEAVNAVIGDTSFIATFGRRPIVRDPERLRLRTHLRYVERRLRKKDVSHLSPEGRAARKNTLDRLRDYWQRGVFPRNTERPGRTPVFIDDRGTLCAAGYLLAKARGRAAAEAVDRAYHLDSVFEMTDSDVLTDWLADSGLTLREVAMIQPSYTFYYDLLFSFETEGATACGANENPDAQRTYHSYYGDSYEPDEEALEPTAMTRSNALACADGIDDTFGSSGFDPSFSQERMVSFEIDPDIRFGLHGLLRLSMSRSAEGPQEVRMVFSKDGGDTFTEVGTLPVPDTSEAFDFGNFVSEHYESYQDFRNVWFDDSAKHPAPDSVIIGFQPRFTSAEAANDGGAFYLHDVQSRAYDLPVELTGFEATADGRAAQLRWRTASETNNDGFAVQHRRPGATGWRDAGFVEGHGTTETPQRYAFRAEDLPPGAHVFRLKQIDRDGGFEHSKTVEVTIAAGETFALRAAGPNPFRDRTQVTLTARGEQQQTVRVAVYDARGRRVQVLHDGPLAASGAPHRFTLDGQGLASGLYLIRATGPEHAATQTVTLAR